MRKNKRKKIKNTVSREQVTEMLPLMKDLRIAIELHDRDDLRKLSQLELLKGCMNYSDMGVFFTYFPKLKIHISTEALLATEYALTKNNRLNNMITLPEVNAHTIGQLMFFFMLETAYVGAMLDINTFNQPGVEEGKNATYALLGRAGYEEKANELNARPQKSENYIV